jgi:hypothetical protein
MKDRVFSSIVNSFSPPKIITRARNSTLFSHIIKIIAAEVHYFTVLSGHFLVEKTNVLNKNKQIAAYKLALQRYLKVRKFLSLRDWVTR